MSLRTEFQNLRTQQERLNEVFSDLRRLLDDHPAQGEKVLLLDSFGDVVEDLLGWLEESSQICAPLLPADPAARNTEFDANLARRALVVCQELFNRKLQRFLTDLVSYDKISQLLQFGRERGGEWHGWAKGIKLELETCQQQLYLTNEVMFRCWVELAEWIGMTSIAVHSTSIGQQITLPSQREVVETAK